MNESAVFFVNQIIYTSHTVKCLNYIHAGEFGEEFSNKLFDLKDSYNLILSL